MNHPWITRILIVVVTVALCGVPELVAQNAQQTAPAPPPQSPVQGTTVDPSRGPLAPAPTTSSDEQQTAPDAPSATRNVNPPPQRREQPLGAGTAQEGVTSGGPASRPAGSAIAPAKQRQTRSLLIKLGAIAGAGIALGTILALSKGTPPKPPGAR
jgi:hypothetical protein